MMGGTKPPIIKNKAMNKEVNNKKQEIQFNDLLDSIFKIFEIKDLILLSKQLKDYISKESYKYKAERENINGVRWIIKRNEELLFRNISGIRNLLLTLTTISIAILGVILSLLGNILNGNIELNYMAIYFGLFSFLLCVLSSIIYLFIIHNKENELLSKVFKIDKEAFDNYQRLLNESIRENISFLEYSKKRDKLIQENYKLEALFGVENEKEVSSLKRINFLFPFSIASFLIGVISLIFIIL